MPVTNIVIYYLLIIVCNPSIISLRSRDRRKSLKSIKTACIFAISIRKKLVSFHIFLYCNTIVLKDLYRLTTFARIMQDLAVLTSNLGQVIVQILTD